MEADSQTDRKAASGPNQQPDGMRVRIPNGALPRFPASVLVLRDVRSLLFERRARIEPSWHKRLGYRLEAARYRRFEREYGKKYDLVITVSRDDEAWLRRRLRLTNVTTVPIPVD